MHPKFRRESTHIPDVKLLDISANMEGVHTDTGRPLGQGGVPLLWYPMRVTYHREMLIKANFDALGIECFVPMKYELAEEGPHSEERLVPAIHNLIFVHSTQTAITHLKMERREFAPLRYMMTHSDNGEMKIMTVPDREMDNFIKAVSVKDRSLLVTSDSDYFSKIGKMVRVTEGQFKDVVGVVKRIKKNRCVVVRIQGVAAAVIANIPIRFLEAVDG